MPDDNDDRKPFICGFCKSRNTASGEVIKLGDEAREYRDAPEELRKLREKLTAAEQTVTELRAELAAKKKPATVPDDEDDD